MRKTFYNEFKNQDAWLLYNDVGYGVLEVDNPRCRNVGISEQAMIGMAAGMASCGEKVFCYSIAPHLIRAWEFVRNLLAGSGYNVILVGVGEGDDYKNLGRSHMVTVSEMVALCDAIRLRYVFPGDRDHLIECVRGKGPLFLHLSKGGFSER